MALVPQHPNVRPSYVKLGVQQPWSVHVVILVLSHDLIVMLMRDDGLSLWITL